MSKSRILIILGLLIVMLAYAVFLWIGTESQFGDFIFSNAISPALLFFVFFGAVAGIMKILVDAALPTRMPRTETGAWERTRIKGKLSYILNALLFFGLPTTVMLAIQVANTELTPDIIRNFVVLGLVLIGGVAAIAASLWTYNESIYLKATETESRTDENVGSVSNAE